jgi:hypothetical protein
MKAFGDRNAIESKDNNEDDGLNILVRRIFEAIDTYYIESAAEEVKQLILEYVNGKNNIET